MVLCAAVKLSVVHYVFPRSESEFLTWQALECAGSFSFLCMWYPAAHFDSYALPALPIEGIPCFQLPKYYIEVAKMVGAGG